MANPTFTDTDDPKEKNRHISNKSDRSLDLYDASYDSTDADQGTACADYLVTHLINY